MQTRPPRKIEGMIGGSKLRKDELEAWKKLIPLNRKWRILEIGTYCGASSAVIAKERPDCSFFCVDAYPAFKEFKHNKQPNQNLFYGFSSDLMRFFPPRVFHMIFVDGAHDFDGVYADLDISKKLLKRDGVLLAHDYRDALQMAVKPAVDKWCADNDATVEVVAGTVARIRI